jgi:hypothetical protein
MTSEKRRTLLSTIKKLEKRSLLDSNSAILFFQIGTSRKTFEREFELSGAALDFSFLIIRKSLGLDLAIFFNNGFMGNICLLG